MLGMAEHAGMDSLDVPRICGRQTKHNNVPARSAKEYVKLTQHKITQNPVSSSGNLTLLVSERTDYIA